MQRRHVVLAATLAAAVLVLREAGAFGLSLNKSSAHTSFEGTFHRPEPGDERDTGSKITIVDAALARPAVLADVPGRVTQYVAEITEYDLDGWYWLPLWKQGSCTYRARILRDNVEVADAEGRVSLKVFGLCAARVYRAKIRNQVDQRLRQYIEKNLRR
jgi:hypothetical protein